MNATANAIALPRDEMELFDLTCEVFAYLESLERVRADKVVVGRYRLCRYHDIAVHDWLCETTELAGRQTNVGERTVRCRRERERLFQGRFCRTNALDIAAEGNLNDQLDDLEEKFRRKSRSAG